MCLFSFPGVLYSCLEGCLKKTISGRKFHLLNFQNKTNKFHKPRDRIIHKIEATPSRRFPNAVTNELILQDTRNCKIR